MKRSPMPPRSKPMSRGTSTFKRTTCQIGQVGKSADKPKRKQMRSNGPRMTPIRRAAQGEDCTILLPGVCNRNPETTVLCHDNRLKSGKGMGLKAPDTEAAFGCSCCHDVLDGRRPRPEGMTPDMLWAYFDLAVERTHQRLKEKGTMK